MCHDHTYSCSAVDLQIIDGVLKDYKAKHNCLPPRIICTGHSLGGALATLAAAHIAINHEEYREEHTDYTQRPLQVYTFGAPRVGDKLLSTLW
jgi:predicted lipase